MHTGFDIVVGSGSEKKGRIEYLCVNHGKPRNTRQLEGRKRETNSEPRTASGCAFSLLRRLMMEQMEGKRDEF